MGFSEPGPGNPLVCRRIEQPWRDAFERATPFCLDFYQIAPIGPSSKITDDNVVVPGVIPLWADNAASNTRGGVRVGAEDSAFFVFGPPKQMTPIVSAE
jgi:hypothetical protein